MNADFPHSTLGKDAEHWNSPLRIAAKIRQLGQTGFQRFADETDAQCCSCQYAISKASDGKLGWGRVTGSRGWKHVYAFTAYLAAERARCVTASANFDLVTAELTRLTAAGWEIKKKSWE